MISVGKSQYLVSWIFPMYTLRPGIKINQFVVHFPVTISVILYHWNWRGPVVLLIFSSCELRRLILVPSCFIIIKRLLSLFLCTARFIPWKLNKTIKQSMLIQKASYVTYLIQNSKHFNPESQTSTLCLNRRYLPWVLLPPTCTIISHCKQSELPSISQ
jgi:hypothetical protein